MWNTEGTAHVATLAEFIACTARLRGMERECVLELRSLNTDGDIVMCSRDVELRVEYDGPVDEEQQLPKRLVLVIYARGPVLTGCDPVLPG